MSIVEEGRGLVQKENVRLLGERGGDEGSLAFSAAEEVHGTLREGLHPGEPEGSGDDSDILGRLTPKGLLPGVPRHEGELAHREGEGVRSPLGNPGDSPGDLLSREASKGSPLEEHIA